MENTNQNAQDVITKGLVLIFKQEGEFEVFEGWMEITIFEDDDLDYLLTLYIQECVCQNKRLEVHQDNEKVRNLFGEFLQEEMRLK